MIPVRLDVAGHVRLVQRAEQAVAAGVQLGAALVDPDGVVRGRAVLGRHVPVDLGLVQRVEVAGAAPELPHRPLPDVVRYRAGA